MDESVSNNLKKKPSMMKNPDVMWDCMTHAQHTTSSINTTCHNKKENNWDSTEGAMERCMFVSNISGEWQWRHAEMMAISGMFKEVKLCAGKLMFTEES